MRQREHGWRWTAFVNGYWKGVSLAVFLVILVFILFAHSSPGTPVHTPAYEQQQAKLHEENEALAYQEEQQRAEYAAHRGP
jgi:hypothetical protein